MNNKMTDKCNKEYFDGACIMENGKILGKAKYINNYKYEVMTSDDPDQAREINPFSAKNFKVLTKKEFPEKYI